MQRQRLLHPGLPARHQPALHGAAGPRLRPAQRRGPCADRRLARAGPARDALARGVPDDEPGRARVVAPAAAARDSGAVRAVERGARAAAGRRFLYRLQRVEDAAHRAVVPRHPRPFGNRLRGDGRGRPVLRRLPVPRRRFRHQQQGRLRDDRRSRLGRSRDGAVVVPLLPDLDRRGVAAQLRDAVRHQAVRPQPVPRLSRRPCRPPCAG